MLLILFSLYSNIHNNFKKKIKKNCIHNYFYFAFKCIIFLIIIIIHYISEIYTILYYMYVCGPFIDFFLFYMDVSRKFA